MLSPGDNITNVLQDFGCGQTIPELIYLTPAQLARLAQLALAQQAQTTDSMVDLNVLHRRVSICFIL